MKIYSLSGASGTGKSTSALHIAHERQIPAIIDDGLLIVRGEKVAGTSAKFENNALKAVRRAIFEDDLHRKEIISAFSNNALDSILIIGTSDKMTTKIAKRLQLGEIDEFIHVEDVRSSREIQKARFVREIQGKHLMPVPYRQVEQNFFKRFIQRGMDIITPNREKIGETTIVRPDFHQQSVTIARNVYVDVLKHVVGQNTQVLKLTKIQITLVQIPKVIIEIQIKAPVDYFVPTMLENLQQEIADSFDFHFNIVPETIDVKVMGIGSIIEKS